MLFLRMFNGIEKCTNKTNNLKKFPHRRIVCHRQITNAMQHKESHGQPAADRTRAAFVLYMLSCLGLLSYIELYRVIC